MARRAFRTRRTCIICSAVCVTHLGSYPVKSGWIFLFNLAPSKHSTQGFLINNHAIAHYAQRFPPKQIHVCHTKVCNSKFDEHVKQNVDEASVAKLAVSLAKNCVGSGVLSLSAGVAAFTNTYEGAIFAALLVWCMAAVAAYTFYMVGSVCAKTHTQEWGSTWSATVGQGSAWLPRLAVLSISCMSCIVYSMILGDTLAAGFQLIISTSSEWSLRLGHYCNRGTMLGVLTPFVLFPLCSANNFASVSTSSAMGVIANLYLAVFTFWRWIDGSYAPGGRYCHNISAMPTLPQPAASLHDFVNLRAVVLAANVAMAFMSHTMAPGMWKELQPGPDASVPQQKAALRRLRKTSLWGYGVGALLCTVIMLSGFLTFGNASSGFLLANYAPEDAAANVARVCVLASVLFGYPLNFLPLRAGFIEELPGQMKEKFAKKGRLLTALLLLLICAVAVSLHDLQSVQAFSGAVLGSFVVFVAPPLMQRSFRLRGGRKQTWKCLLESGIAAVGFVVTVVGVWKNAV